jgi:hypothetical protein
MREVVAFVAVFAIGGCGGELGAPAVDGGSKSQPDVTTVPGDSGSKDSVNETGDSVDRSAADGDVDAGTPCVAVGGVCVPESTGTGLCGGGGFRSGASCGDAAAYCCTPSRDAAQDVGEGGDGGGSFTCGVASCDGQSEICKHVVGGPPPGVDYSACAPIPAECASDVSCTCVTAALGGIGITNCTSAGGDITVQVAVP